MGCQQNNATKIISSISNITLNCTTVDIKFAGGTHILNGLLKFTDHVEETRINGAPHGLKSVIMCLNNGGIRFSENSNANEVFISNLTFTYCAKPFVSGWKPYHAALHFKYASYSLENVEVSNTEGYGIYAEQSQTQEINKCRFNNNTQGHTDNLRSGSIYTDVTEVQMNLTETKFLESKVGYAVYINTFGNATVSIRNSIFSNNSNGGIYITGTTRVEVRDCLITHNKGNGIDIDMVTGVNTDLIIVHVSNCLVENNLGTGMRIDRSSKDTLIHMKSDISNVTFTNNSRALYLTFYTWIENNDHRVTKISESKFYNHKLLPT